MLHLRGSTRPQRFFLPWFCEHGSECVDSAYFSACWAEIRSELRTGNIPGWFYAAKAPRKITNGVLSCDGSSRHEVLGLSYFQAITHRVPAVSQPRGSFNSFLQRLRRLCPRDPTLLNCSEHHVRMGELKDNARALAKTHLKISLESGLAWKFE